MSTTWNEMAGCLSDFGLNDMVITDFKSSIALACEQISCGKGVMKAVVSVENILLQLPLPRGDSCLALRMEASNDDKQCNMACTQGDCSFLARTM